MLCRIRSSTVGVRTLTGPPPTARSAAGRHVALERVRRRSVGERRARRLDALGDRVRRAGRVDRRAGVDHGQIGVHGALPALLAAQDRARDGGVLLRRAAAAVALKRRETSSMPTSPGASV